MIQINHLSVKFDDQIILEDINLEVNDGEILVLLGESGVTIKMVGLLVSGECLL